MRFKTECSAISSGLRVIRRLAPPTDGIVTVISDGKTVSLVSRNEINQCRISVPGEVLKRAEFGILIDAIDQATKGRGEVELTYKNTVLSIKSKAYSAELPTVEAMGYEDTDVQGEKKIKISGDQAAWLIQAVVACSLKATTEVSSFMPLGVAFGKNAFVACFDTSHMSFISSKEIKGESEFIVPSDLMAGILDSFGAKAFLLHVSKSSIRVSNKLCEVRLNLPDLDDQGPNLTTVQQKARTIKKTNGTEMSLIKADVTSFLDNSKAVALKERGQVRIKAEDGKVIMAVTTVNGTVKASMPCKAKVDFSIDYEYFDEMVRKSHDPVQLKVIDKTLLVCTSSKATLVASLNSNK